MRRHKWKYEGRWTEGVGRDRWDVAKCEVCGSVAMVEVSEVDLGNPGDAARAADASIIWKTCDEAMTAEVMRS